VKPSTLEVLKNIEVALGLILNRLGIQVEDGTQPNPKTKAKPKPVNFRRYIRPLKGCEIDPQRGVTLLANLNYNTRTIDVQYSICNHRDGQPSFSKQLGAEIASKKKSISIPMWDKVGPLLDNDITNYIVDHLCSGLIPLQEAHHIVDMFADADRKFRY